MRSKKANKFPEYIIPPLATEPKKSSKTHEETCSEILTAIRQHTPEQQNWILKEILKETALERHNELTAIQDDLRRSEINFKEFIELQHSGERALNEMQTKGR